MGEYFRLNESGLEEALKSQWTAGVAHVNESSTADDLAGMVAFARGAGVLEAPPELEILIYPDAVSGSGTALVTVFSRKCPDAHVAAGSEAIPKLVDLEGDKGDPLVRKSIQAVASVVEHANRAVRPVRLLEGFWTGLQRTAEEDPGSVADLLVVVRVADPDALETYARKRYAACWFDDDWRPANLAEAAMEALVLSNENPSPVDIGIEIVDWHAGSTARRLSGGRGSIGAGASESPRDHTRKGCDEPDAG